MTATGWLKLTILVYPGGEMVVVELSYACNRSCALQIRPAKENNSPFDAITILIGVCLINEVFLQFGHVRVSDSNTCRVTTIVTGGHELTTSFTK